MGIGPASLMLLPLHIVLLELIIDPTCSIVLERQPAETDIMERGPRNPKDKMLNARVLVKSVAQGLMIFAASFGAYWYTLAQNPDNAAVARSMGLGVIIIANLFLVTVNSSGTDSVLKSIKLLMKDKVMRAVNIITLSGLAAIIYIPGLNRFLKLTVLSLPQVLTVLILGSVSVLWYEVVKIYNKKTRKNI